MRAAGVALAVLLTTTACAINPAWTIRGQGADSGALLLDGVPFHPQTQYQCGPAALATVLGASGVDASPEALAPQVYLPGRRGSLQLELVGATRRAGVFRTSSTATRKPSCRNCGPGVRYWCCRTFSYALSRAGITPCSSGRTRPATG